MSRPAAEKKSKRDQSSAARATASASAPRSGAGCAAAGSAVAGSATSGAAAGSASCAASASVGVAETFYGNVTVATVAGTRWYLLKAGSSSIADDYGSIDWDDFYITTINVSGETAPYVSKGLKFVNLDDWKRYYRDSENADDADTQAYGEPLRVIKSPDSRKFGLSPIPDKVYNVHFYAFTKPTKLSAHDDTIVFPEQYSNVITSRVRYYVWQFKESPQQAAFALDDHKKAMRHMKSNLMNPTPRVMTDDRRYF